MILSNGFYHLDAIAGSLCRRLAYRGDIARVNR